MPYKLVYRNGIPMTEWVPGPKKALPPLTGNRGRPAGGGGYFPKSGKSWRVAAGKDPYLIDRMVRFGATKPPLDPHRPGAPTTPPATGGSSGGAGGSSGGGGGGGSSSTTTTTANDGNPWQSYLDELDRRERQGYMDRIKAHQESARNYLEALAGFGQALQGNAAQQWGNVIKAYGLAGDTTTAYQNAAASSYGQGLMDANRQMAADFAAIGQGGPADIRDDAAALAQVQSVGGTNPGATTGLVGRAWGSYGETRPGTIGFMTGQNQMQVEREALQTERELHSEMQQALSDNPQQAMQMWGAYEEWKNAKTEAEAKAKQQELQNKMDEAKNAREERALGLQESTINRQWLDSREAQAWNRTNATGRLHIVGKNGKIIDTGRPAPGSAAGRAATTAATSRANAATRAATAAASLAEQTAHNRTMEGIQNAKLGISQQQADNATKRAEAYARYQQWRMKGKKGKNPTGLSEAQVRQYGANAGAITRQLFYGDDKNEPGTPEQAMKQMLARYIPYQIAWKAIYQYANLSEAPANWKKVIGPKGWNPKYKPPKKKKK